MTEEQNTEALKRARTFSDNKDRIDGFYNGYVQATMELQKQIQIDAEHIIDLQKQNGELTDKVKELEVRCNELFLQTCEQAEKIKELEAQIEKMKRCFNCKYRDKFVESKCGECERYSKWEIKENDC